MPDTILDAAGLEQTIQRLAHEVLDRVADLDALAVIGIRRRGVPLAERLAQALRGARDGGPDWPALGALDITLYRDDLSLIADQPVVRRTEIDFDLEGKHVILVDDVLYTGRTVRAAIDALFALGRPSRVELLVLVDRGHRELPIEAGYVGRVVETARGDRVHVLFEEFDGKVGVEVARGGRA